MIVNVTTEGNTPSTEVRNRRALAEDRCRCVGALEQSGEKGFGLVELNGSIILTRSDVFVLTGRQMWRPPLFLTGSAQSRANRRGKARREEEGLVGPLEARRAMLDIDLHVLKGHGSDVLASDWWKYLPAPIKRQRPLP